MHHRAHVTVLYDMDKWILYLIG